MAATRLSSISKIKPSFLINSLRLSPVNAGFESTLRTFDFPMILPIIGSSIDKPRVQTLDPSIFSGSTIADRFHIDVRGDPITISDGEEDEFGDDADGFDDDDNPNIGEFEPYVDDDDDEDDDDVEKK